MEALAEGSICIEQALMQSIGEVVPSCGRCDRCKGSKPKEKDWSYQASILLTALEEKKGIEFVRDMKK